MTWQPIKTVSGPVPSNAGASLRQLLDLMAAQKTWDEMDSEQRNGSDFEYAYDCMVRNSRDALRLCKRLGTATGRGGR